MAERGQRFLTTSCNRSHFGSIHLRVKPQNSMHEAIVCQTKKGEKQVGKTNWLAKFFCTVGCLTIAQAVPDVVSTCHTLSVSAPGKKHTRREFAYKLNCIRSKANHATKEAGREKSSVEVARFLNKRLVRRGVQVRCAARNFLK